jgi:cytidylate kinase
MPLIAIDGPAGSGKSTVARAVAQRLGVGYLDSGAMYRSVAYAVLRDGIEPGDSEAVVSLAKRLTIDVGARVTVDGEDATEAIRSPEVNRAVSLVSAIPGVRAELVTQQREWAARHHGSGVVEGRDIGTVVFPDADVKVFLVADEQVRAARRAEESDIARRDRLDSTRAASPLEKADDAVEIDTTSTSVEGVVDKVLALVGTA